MNQRPQILAPISRVFSAGTLLIWIAAMALCIAHCSFGKSHDAQTKSSCCEKAGKKQSGENAPKLSCLTFKSTLVPDSTPETFGMDSASLYQFPIWLSVFDSKFRSAVALSIRQSQRDDSSCKPAVYLAAANLSHAPPVLL